MTMQTEMESVRKSKTRMFHPMKSILQTCATARVNTDRLPIARSLADNGHSVKITPKPQKQFLRTF